MKTFEQLGEGQKERAVRNQLTYFGNLVTHEDYPGMERFLGPEAYARVRERIQETIRLAKVGEESGRAPELVLEACAAEVMGAAQGRARRAFYREPPDLVYDIRATVERQVANSSGDVKIRLLEEGEREGLETNGEKAYGLFVHDTFMVARVRCTSKFPPQWQCEDLQGRRLSPVSFFDLPSRPQRRKVREWAIDYVNRGVRAGHYDHLVGSEEGLTAAGR